jgi:hypothetical protein
MLAELAPRRRRAVFVAIGATILLTVLVGLTLTGNGAGHDRRSSPITPTVSAAQAGSSSIPASGPVPAAPPSVDPSLASQLAERLKATEDFPPATSTQYPGLSDVDRSQPDLFARALFTELFTRDYAGSSRGNLLSWVHANTGIDHPKVSTLLPAELLMRTSTASLTARFPVVPDPVGWQSLASFHGTSSAVPATVRVSTPPEVQQHILDGSAPAGWTEKLVTGTVTTRTVVNGHAVVHSASVALRLVLWGPPNLASWSLIQAADYNSVAVS